MDANHRTGGLRLPADFIKALVLGADAIALSNSALQAIGCLGMRACHTNNCPVGIVTQKAELRQRLKIEKGAEQLNNFFRASTELMQVMARACGHDRLSGFPLLFIQLPECLLSLVRYWRVLQYPVRYSSWWLLR
jgi:glutamate synthase domain-containing protein 2